MVDVRLVFLADRCSVAGARCAFVRSITCGAATTGMSIGRVSPLPCVRGGSLVVCVWRVYVCACIHRCGTRYDVCNSLLGVRRNAGMLLELTFVTCAHVLLFVRHGIVGICGQPAWI